MDFVKIYEGMIIVYNGTRGEGWGSSEHLGLAFLFIPPYNFPCFFFNSLL